VIGRIGDDVVLEQAAGIELDNVVLDVHEDVLIADKFLFAPINVIACDIVLHRSHRLHRLRKIGCAAGIMEIGLGHIVRSANTEKAASLGALL